VFPVFPVNVPGLFPGSGNELKRFPMFSVFAIGTVSSVSSIACFTGREHWEQRELDRTSKASEMANVEHSWNKLGTGRAVAELQDRVAEAFQRRGDDGGRAHLLLASTTFNALSITNRIWFCDGIQGINSATQ
jgi:hypothetical protein